jgi:DNA-binding XRE family transcriptional regulator
MTPADRIALAAGAQLRRMRVAAGLSQRQVAVFIGTHRPIIYRLERGAHMPTFETCQLYAAVTGGRLADVFTAVDQALGLGRLRCPRVSARAAPQASPT